jgi:hypothetical protein
MSRGIVKYMATLAITAVCGGRHVCHGPVPWHLGVDVAYNYGPIIDI